jgi:hypothetical protein
MIKNNNDNNNINIYIVVYIQLHILYIYMTLFQNIQEKNCWLSERPVLAIIPLKK